MVSIFSIHSWDIFGKVVSGLIGHYCGNFDVILASHILLIIAKA